MNGFSAVHFWTSTRLVWLLWNMYVYLATELHISSRIEIIVSGGQFFFSLSHAWNSDTIGKKDEGFRLAQMLPIAPHAKMQVV